jgi:hypothetical protein
MSKQTNIRIDRELIDQITEIESKRAGREISKTLALHIALNFYLKKNSK